MSSHRAPCPVCDRGPRDTALSVTTDERGTVSHCHRCGYTCFEPPEHRPAAPVRPGAGGQRPPQSGPAERCRPQDWSLTAERIWQSTLPLSGSLAAVYLEHRHCVLPPADADVRFLPADAKYPPTMVARITDARTAAPISLHFTTLAADGRSRGDRRLLAGHRKQHGVIRLWPDETVARGLAIAEGIESALCAARLFRPMWACVDAGNLEAFTVLAGIEALTIFADHDDAGLGAARECARRWRAAGREVRIRTPRTAGHDAADLAREVAA